MRFPTMKFGASVVLGLLLITAGCNEVADNAVAPGFGPLASVNSQGPQKLDGTFNNPQGNGRTCDPSGKPDAGTGQVYQSAEWIDRQGGYVVIFGTSGSGDTIAHVLSVPKNAVRNRTLFCMRLFNSNHMQVKLKAVALEKVRGEVTEVNVGKDGFREPVELYMSYHQALVTRMDAAGQPYQSPLTVEEAQRLYVAYEPEGTTTPTDRMPTANLSAWDKYIVAKLPHFSKYVMMLD
jgi:hypothetical protein